MYKREIKKKLYFEYFVWLGHVLRKEKTEAIRKVGIILYVKGKREKYNQKSRRDVIESYMRYAED